MEPVRARVSRNGQISLPAELRRRWGVGPGDDVAIIDEGDYALVLPIPDDIVGALAGVFAGPGPTTDEMREESRREESRREEQKAEDRKHGRLPDAP